MSEAELSGHLAYWQTQLGLQAWTIKVVVSRQTDMPCADANGTCRRNAAMQKAKIHLLDPIDHGNDAFPIDRALPVLAAIGVAQPTPHGEGTGATSSSVSSACASASSLAEWTNRTSASGFRYTDYKRSRGSRAGAK